MLEEKYKLSLDRYRFEPPYLGFALCCGQVPKVDFDSRDTNAKYYVGHMACLICNTQLGVIANGDGELPERVGFLYSNWNKHFKSNPLFNMPEGFKWVSASIDYKPHGETINKHKHFLIIKQIGNKVFNYCFYRNKIVELELPKRFVSVSCSIGTNYAHFVAYNYKWKKKLEDFLLVSLEPKPWSLYD